MPPNLIKQLTAWLALALVGAVGGVGTGLHSVFDCCHHCSHGCSDHSHSSEHCNADDHSHCYCGFSHDHTPHNYDDQDAVQVSSKDESQEAFLSAEHDCLICLLLSQFHSTRTFHSSPFGVWATRGTVAISIPAFVACSSNRLEPPRGPPSVCC